MAAGQITVEMLAKTGAFETDLGRAAKATERLQRQVERQVAALQKQAELAGKSTEEIKLYTLAQKQATEEQLKAAQTAIATKAATEQQARDTAARLNFLASLREEAAAVGKTKVELLAMRAAELGVGDAAAPLIAKLKEADKPVKQLGVSAAQTAQQMQFAAIQVKDFAQSVIAGQNPLIAFTQQGLTMVSIFGGIGNTFRALGKVFTPSVFGFLALGTSVATFVAAAFKGRNEIGELQKGLILTNNAAGVTASTFGELAEQISKLSSGTIGASRDALQQVVGAGFFGPNELKAAGIAVINLERLTGKAADEIIGDFKGMRDSALQWAYEANKSYNFLTPKIYDQIRAMQAAGKADEARRITLEALNESLGRKTPNSLGLLERALKTAKDAASSFWDSLLNVGRPETIEDRIRAQLQIVESAKRGIDEPASIGPYGGPRKSGAERFAAAQQVLRALYDQQRAEAEVVAAQAADAKENREQLEREQQAFQSASQSRTNASAQKRLADAEASYRAEIQALNNSFEQRLLGEASYAKASESLERRRLAAHLRALEEEATAERAIRPANPADVISQQARLLQIESRRVAVRAELAAVSERARRGEFAPEPQAKLETAQSTFNKFERAGQADLEADLRERTLATLAGLRDLRDASRDISVALIRDDQARAAAVLQIETETLKKRLDLGSLNVDERKQAEDDFASYVALRQLQLVEDLKPAYQKQLEAWQDTTRLMRESSDEFHSSFIDAGRDAFKQWFVNGEISVKGLADSIQSTLSDIIYKRFIAGPLNELADGIFKTFDGYFKGAAKPGGAEVSGQQLAQQQAAASLSRFGLTSDVSTSALVRLQSAADLASAALAQVAGSSGFGSLSFGSSTGAISNTGLEGLSPEVLQLAGYAGGGRPPVNTPILVGETGPEVFVPDSAGTVYPNTTGRSWSGGRGGGESMRPINVQVVNNTGTPANARVEQRGDGGFRVLLEAVKDGIAGDYQSGGRLSRTQESVFGVRRAPQLLR